MEIIVKTAPESVLLEEYSKCASVFLAGGITDCPNWQQSVIDHIKGTSFWLHRKDLLILNPRRDNFPMDDPSAAEEQIKWEFDALDRADIFSVWFADSASVQPITQYELGRQMALRRSDPKSVVIGVDPKYPRAQDVYVQTELADDSIAKRISASIEGHVINIIVGLGDKAGW